MAGVRKGPYRLILRIVPGRIRREHVEAVKTGVGVLPRHARPMPEGLLRGHIGVAEDGESIATVSVWESPEAARRTLLPDGQGSWAQAVAGDVAELDTPLHFDLDASWILRSDDAPRVIRIAVGRFTKPGSDVEMQELLRTRIPTIGPEMVEAASGRRIVDRTVEVLFYSAWAREPAGARLDQALWPDISLRYDTFSVRTYRALG
jgi:hypothetical protein